MDETTESIASPMESGLPDLKTALVGSLHSGVARTRALTHMSQVHQWTFKNNGVVFRDEDWSRLKKIGTQIQYIHRIHFR